MDEWAEWEKWLGDEESRDYVERIARDPAVLVGKPVIRGTRISVELILEWLSGNLDLDEFFAAYPHLTNEDIRAALLFARDAVRADSLLAGARGSAGSQGLRSWRDGSAGGSTGWVTPEKFPKFPKFPKFDVPRSGFPHGRPSCYTTAVD